MLRRLLYLAPECCCSLLGQFCSLQVLLLRLQKGKYSVLGAEKTSNLFYLALSVLGRLEGGAWSRNTLGGSTVQKVASLLLCPGCAHGFIFPSLLVACSLSDTPLWSPDVLLTASFTLAMSVMVQIAQFWNPIRLYPSVVFWNKFQLRQGCANNGSLYWRPGPEHCYSVPQMGDQTLPLKNCCSSAAGDSFCTIINLWVSLLRGLRECGDAEAYS